MKMLAINSRLWRRLTLALLACTGGGMLYWQTVRPWHLRWRASDDEAARKLPGDDLISQPASVSTRAITIQAAPEQVWRWLVQMGQEHGGLYSYEWLENLVGSDIHNSDRIVPGWQELRVGDTVRLASAKRYPQLYLLVNAVEPSRLLALRSPNLGGPQAAPRDEYGYTWTFVLDPIGAGVTRLLVRSRYQGPPAVVLTTEAMQFVMERAMLRGLRHRTESAPAEPTLAEQLLADADIHLADSVLIQRPAETVYRALREVEMYDIPILRLLMAVRTLGSSESTFKTPIFTALRNTASVFVEEQPGHSITVAGAGKFWTRKAFEATPDRPAFVAADPPDWARLAWTLSLEEALAGTRLRADMRVQSPSDPAAARAFAWYWRSAGWLGATLSQRGVLAAVKRRAERTSMPACDRAMRNGGAAEERAAVPHHHSY
jgi:hypothetical protein